MLFISDSLQVVIKDVHVRYEDTIHDLPDLNSIFAFGITLESIVIESTWGNRAATVKSEGKAENDDPLKVSYKLLDVKNFGVYLCTQGRTWCDGLKEEETRVLEAAKTKRFKDRKEKARERSFKGVVRETSEGSEALLVYGNLDKESSTSLDVVDSPAEELRKRLLGTIHKSSNMPSFGEIDEQALSEVQDFYLIAPISFAGTFILPDILDNAARQRWSDHKSTIPLLRVDVVVEKRSLVVRLSGKQINGAAAVAARLLSWSRCKESRAMRTKYV